MNTLSTPLTPEQIQHVRDQKAKERRYFTVSLSDKVIPEGIPYRCWQCGDIIQTIYNEPKTSVEVKISLEDVQEGKLTGNLCRRNNILFLFV